ncbi:MAG: PP2C family protein-serine/threonine phosphatase [Planctomycetota bacterium]
MTRADLTADHPIHRVNRLLRTVSGIVEPQDIQLEFSRALRERGDHLTADAYVAISRRNMPVGQYKITRTTLPDDKPYEDQNPWTHWDSMPAHTGGFLAQHIFDDDPQPHLFTAFDIPEDTVLGVRLARYKSAILLPLYDDGEPLNWSLMLREAPDSYNEDTLEQTLMRANLVGRMTRSLVIRKEVERLNTKLQDQLDEISSIQRALLPQQLPDVPRLSLASSYLTSNEAGGDYYDVFPVGDGRWAMMIADVSGHGAGAATVVAMMSSIVRGYHNLAEGPSAVFRHLNDQLVTRRIESNFVTAWLGYWDPETGGLEYANAGHHAPLVRDPDGAIDRVVGEHDIPLGILDGRDYPINTHTLTRGQTVILFTDGITEAFSPDSEMFGTERMAASLKECSGQPQCVIAHIHDALFDFTRARARDDDQTILAIRVTS